MAAWPRVGCKRSTPMRYLWTLALAISITLPLAAADLPTFTPPGAKLEKLWGEGIFTEGACEGPDGLVYFSDIGTRIMKFDPKTGTTSVHRDPSRKSNGLKFDAQGRLLACEGASGGNRRVSITEKDGTIRALADNWTGKKFNAPNDLTLDAKGRVYFTDPRYQGKEPREIETESIYRIDPDGTLTQITTDVSRPNGIVISPDGTKLLVADNKPDGQRQLVSFPLAADGSLGAKTLLYNFEKGRGIDGMTVAVDGTVVATAGTKDLAGIWYFSPKGEKIGFLPTPEDPTNLCFAGPDHKTMYVTAGKSLYRIPSTLTGMPTVRK